MSQCHYHPDKRSTASCPTCNQRICDRCRLQGNSLRCGTCQSVFQKGGDDPKKRRVQCANHAGVPTDQRCGGCRKPFCAGCLNGANKCFTCATAAPAPGPAPSSARRATTPLKNAPTGKLKQPAPKRTQWGPIGAAAAGLLVVGVVAMLLLKPAKPAKPYRVSGPLQVAIVAPQAKQALSGQQIIKLQVASAKDVERVELTIDGKYWDRFKRPPFESEWPTSLHPNGAHTLVAKAIYKDKRSVTAKRVVRTLNR